MKTNSRSIFNIVTLLTLFAMLLGFFPTSAVRAESLASLGDFLWAKSVGGGGGDASEGSSIAADSSGNVYTTGRFAGAVAFGPFTLTSAGNFDIFISKMDGEGNFIWADRIGEIADQEIPQAIAVDSSGNVYTVGIFGGTVDFDPGSGISNLTSTDVQDIFLSKLDTNGNFLWAKKMTIYGGARGIAIDSNGNIYIEGYFYDIADFNPDPSAVFNLTSAGDEDIFVSKLDSNGDFVWAKQMGGADDAQSEYGDYPDDLTLDSSGNLYITGSFVGHADFDPGPGTSNLFSPVDDAIFVCKLNSNGDLVWAKAMNGDSVEEGNGIALDASGNVYTTGFFYGKVDFDPGPATSNLSSAGGTDIFVSKLDNNGNFIWARRMGGPDATIVDTDRGNKIVVDSVGNVFTTGNFRSTADFDPGPGTSNLTSSPGGEDIFVSKLDTNGNFVWAKRMGGTHISGDASVDDTGWDIAKDATDDIFVTGKFYGIDADFGTNTLQSAGDADLFVAKLENSSVVTITGNAGVADAILTYTNGTAQFVTADGSGNYVIIVPIGWSGTITPHKIGYSFTPPSASYGNVQSNQTGQVYIADVCPTCADKDTAGVFRPSNGLLYLKNLNITGFADMALNYGLPGDYPVVGDWDGNGTATIGIYRNATFYLRNSNTVGFADIVFAFGQPGDQPIAGDWDGDGVDTIGLYRPSNGQFMLRNSNSAGTADMSFFLGIVGDVGIAGDWDGDGLDTTGVFRPINGIIFLKNTNETGFADIALNYGIPGDKPVTGDWDTDGIDTIGVYRNGVFLLRNSNTVGFADIAFALGIPGDMPIGGDWDGLPLLP